MTTAIVCNGETHRGNGIHIVGNGNTVTGNDCHVIGNNNRVTGNGTHATGNNNTLVGDSTHVVGNSNRQTGTLCTTIGCNNVANGQGVVAAGTSVNLSSVLSSTVVAGTTRATRFGFGIHSVGGRGVRTVESRRRGGIAAAEKVTKRLVREGPTTVFLPQSGGNDGMVSVLSGTAGGVTTINGEAVEGLDLSRCAQVTISNGTVRWTGVDRDALDAFFDASASASARATAPLLASDDEGDAASAT